MREDRTSYVALMMKLSLFDLAPCEFLLFNALPPHPAALSGLCFCSQAEASCFLHDLLRLGGRDQIPH